MLQALAGRETGRIQTRAFHGAACTEYGSRLEIGGNSESSNASEGSVDVLQHNESFSALDVDPSEARYILAGTSSENISVFDAITMKRLAFCNATRTGSVHSISSVQWYSHDSGLFLTSSSSGRICLWDASQLTVAFTHLETQLSSQSGNLSYNFTPTTPCPVFEIAQQSTQVAIASASFNLRILDLNSGNICMTIPLGENKNAHVNSINWSPHHEHLLVSGCSDGVVRVFDTRRSNINALLLEFDAHYRPHNSTRVNHSVAESVALSLRPSSKHRAPQTKRMPNTETQSKKQKRTRTSLLSDEDEPVNRPLNNHKQQTKSFSHESSVLRVLMSADGQSIYSHGADRTLRSWDLMTGCVRVPRFELIRIRDRSKLRIVRSSGCHLLFVAADRTLLSMDGISGRSCKLIETGHAPITALTSHPFYPTVFAARRSETIKKYAPTPHANPQQDNLDEPRSVRRNVLSESDSEYSSLHPVVLDDPEWYSSHH